MADTVNHAAGFRWTIIGQVVGQGALLAGSILLSRALGPSDFGLFAMVSVIGSISGIIVSFGVTHAIVQQQKLSQVQLSSLFWFNLALGILFTALFFLGAPLLAAFYDQPELVTVSRWYSVVPLLTAFANVPAGVLTRDLNYKSQAIAVIIAVTVSYAVSLFSVFQGAGVLAFVIQAALYQAVLATINFIWSRWLPSVTFSTSSIIPVKKFSVPLLGSQVIDFLFFNLDVLLAGKFLGKRELGVYGRANALVMLPANNVGQLLAKSFFPIFSANQQQPKVLTDYYLRSTKVLLMLVLPALALLAFIAHDLILFLLGKDWLDSADLVVLLAGLGIFGAVNTFNDSLIISQGRSKLLLKITIADKAILAISLFVGLKYGIAGLAIAKVFAVVLASVPRGFVVLRLTNINFFDFVKRFNAVLIALIALVLAELGLIAISGQLPLFLRLVVTTIPAAGIYAAILFLMKEPALDDLKKLFRFNKK
ncbi:MAG: lipopolysaccharide biosynthesis protein [Cyclobacteriaceae bacterium]